jgi:putative ABC transport system permease protein
MIRTAIKGMLARKLRTILTSLAIVLGVGMVSAAYILTDTWQGATDKLSTAAYDNVDAVVTTRAAFDVSADEVGGKRPPLPASALADVRALPEVGVAAGDVSDQVRLVGADDKAIGGSGGSPSFAEGFDARAPGAAALSPFKLRSGRFARSRGEVTIDAGTAKKQHLGVGQTIGVSSHGASQRFTIVGTATFGSVESLGGATAAIFDLRQAQALTGKDGKLDSILVRAREGVAPGELRHAIAAVLPHALQVETAAGQDRFGLDGLREGLGIVQKFLVAFGIIALFVGGFVIFNTLAITVAQRSRDFALLRTIGASRRQVLGSVVLEAVLTGLVASLIGIAVGLGLTSGLSAAFKALDIDLPASETVLAGRTVIVALLFGVGVTTVAGLVPAVRATRVDPVAALREGAVPASRGSRRTPVVGAALSALSVAALVYGMFAGGVSVVGRLAAIGLGTLLLFVGVAMLSSRLVPPLASTVGWPVERLGRVAGRLARENAIRNPGRTAATAAALMIGIALVTFVAILGQGLRTSFSASWERQVSTNYVVTAEDGWTPIPAKTADALAKTPGVGAVTTIREDQARAFGEVGTVSGIDPATVDSALHFHWKAGSDSALREIGTDGAIVTKKFAEEHDLAAGERFRMTSPSGKRLDLRIAGIDARPEFNPLELADVSISQALFDRSFENPDPRLVFVKLDDGADAASRSALERAIAPYPGAKLRTSAEYEKLNQSWIDGLVGLLYAMLGLSVIVSLFGIINTLALAVFERTRELGTLRAVGMTRRQVRRMMRYESVMVALIGAVLGMAVGLLLAALVTHALSGEGLEFSIPARTLVAFLLVAIIAGMLAAILPARRASRLNVLQALQYE